MYIKRQTYYYINPLALKFFVHNTNNKLKLDDRAIEGVNVTHAYNVEG
jgi:hypothetical protein